MTSEQTPPSAGSAQAGAHLVLLTTGGTIAGWAEAGAAQAHYQAGALTGAALLQQLQQDPPRAPGQKASLNSAGLGAASAGPIVLDELARMNSKDADEAFWWQLYQRLQLHLSNPAAAAIVITHGTDTLEETAFFLSEVLPMPLPKPVLLVAAMRPASHPEADGPQNLQDALQLAQWLRHEKRQGSKPAGVLVVCGGLVYAGSHVQKLHGLDVQPFVQRDRLQGQLAIKAEAAGAQIQYGAEGMALAWPRLADSANLVCDFFEQNKKKSAPMLPEQLSKLQHPSTCPRVEIVTSHAGSSALLVQALLAQHATQPLYGLVVAGTGCGTIHRALQSGLEQAQALGIRVVRASQCLGLVTVPPEDSLLCWPELSPRQARVRLILQGLQEA